MARPETIDEVLDRVAGRKIQLCIGSRSGYFFIGTVKDFQRDIDLLEHHYHARYDTSVKLTLDRMKKASAPIDTPQPWIPLRDRKVRAWYFRDLPGEPMRQLAVLVRGNDQGEHVFSYEYAQALPKYYKEYVDATGVPLPIEEVPRAWLRAPALKPQPKQHPEMFIEQWMDLAHAVLAKAADDYRADYRTVLASPDKNRFRMEDMAQIEDFFSGPASFYAQGEDTSRFPRMLREEVEEDLRNKAGEPA